MSLPVNAPTRFLYPAVDALGPDIWTSAKLEYHFVQLAGFSLAEEGLAVVAEIQHPNLAPVYLGDRSSAQSI